MEKVFTAQHAAEAHLVAARLEAEGIAAEVRGEDRFAIVRGAACMDELKPTVWVEDPAEADRARALALACVEATAGEGPGWTCACGEALGPAFETCWRCGALRAPE